MKKLLTLTLLGAASALFTSCVVHEPVPATTTTTTTRQSTTVAQPATVDTASRMGSGY